MNTYVIAVHSIHSDYVEQAIKIYNVARYDTQKQVISSYFVKVDRLKKFWIVNHTIDHEKSFLITYDGNSIKALDYYGSVYS